MTATRLLPATFVVLWATGVIGAKAGVPYAEPFTFLALRFGLVIVVLTVVALIFRAPWPRRRPALDAMVAGGLIHGLYLGGVFWAIDRGMPAGVSALILGLQPILTAVLAGLMLGERTRPRHWAGLGLGLAGLLLVLWPRFGDGAGGITLATVSATLGAVAAITLGSIHQKRFGARMDLRTGSVFQYLGALLVVGGAAWLGESMAVDWTPAFMLSLGWLVLALSIGAISLMMILIRDGSVSQAATYLYLVPGVSVLFAWLLFGEALSPVQLGGMVVTLIAVALATGAGKVR